MIKFILEKFIGTKNERVLKSIQPIVERVNSLESSVKSLSDDSLKAKTKEFKQRLSKGETLDEILPEAFAVVRETAVRTLGMRHFDVQIIGGVVLHRGNIAEMVTGEGKTLVATLPVYLNALTGKGVHVITVNDYLANRDAEWMGPVYKFLGMSVGVIQSNLSPQERKIAYGSDITYGTNNEFGFDYLRDNMTISKEEMVQGCLNYAIVDEVDSILIDEARTPLIISGPADISIDKYYKINKIISKLKCGSRDEITKEETGDYVIDEKAHTAYLTERGEERVLELLGIEEMHSMQSMEYRHHVNQALKAHTLFKRDVDYIVKDGQVIIIDEFTGRLMPGRRWSDGLHQAVEAKEGVQIERENQTLATVTFQNYFRMYKKLAGMTGTAATEANEFHHIYKLDVVVIPTNKPLVRTNLADSIYRTEGEKFNAVVEEIKRLHDKGIPVLVGTISIEKSEILSKLLQKANIPHRVLNAKYHEMEAHIVAQAGRLGAVTIATNMAGRGTDIVLGGNYKFLAEDLEKQIAVRSDKITAQEKKKMFDQLKNKLEQEHKKVVELGGLHILGTERHESRRIDNQLRGRSGRQGDPGLSRFYLSLQDNLMRIFGSDKISVIMERLGMEEGMEIQHPLVSRSIETAQKRVEGHNFEIRKQLLEYDNVMNKQREIIYAERKTVLESDNLKNHVFEILEEVLDEIIDTCYSVEIENELDFNILKEKLRIHFAIKPDINDKQTIEELKELLLKMLKDIYSAKEETIGYEQARFLEKVIMLQIIDSKWKDHLYSMDSLREGIGLRAYGQRDPLVEYQHEGFAMFSEMIKNIKLETIEFLFKVQQVQKEENSDVFAQARQQLVHNQISGFNANLFTNQNLASSEEAVSHSISSGSTDSHTPYKRQGKKVGRNEPCPCGSGKKYKKCCGI